MIRWLPRSLFSRMVLILLGGLVVAQLVSFAIYWEDLDDGIEIGHLLSLQPLA